MKKVPISLLAFIVMWILMSCITTTLNTIATSDDYSALQRKVEKLKSDNEDMKYQIENMENRLRFLEIKVNSLEDRIQDYEKFNR